MGIRRVGMSLTGRRWPFTRQTLRPLASGLQLGQKLHWRDLTVLFVHHGGTGNGEKCHQRLGQSSGESNRGESGKKRIYVPPLAFAQRLGESAAKAVQTIQVLNPRAGTAAMSGGPRGHLFNAKCGIRNGEWMGCSISPPPTRGSSLAGWKTCPTDSAGTTNMRFVGKAVVVTGGSKGIGEGCARV